MYLAKMITFWQNNPILNIYFCKTSITRSYYNSHANVPGLTWSGIHFLYLIFVLCVSCFHKVSCIVQSNDFRLETRQFRFKERICHMQKLFVLLKSIFWNWNRQYCLGLHDDLCLPFSSVRLLFSTLMCLCYWSFVLEHSSSTYCA